MSSNSESIVRCLIIASDTPTAQSLHTSLKQTRLFEVSCENVSEENALKQVAETLYDILFLDLRATDSPDIDARMVDQFLNSAPGVPQVALLSAKQEAFFSKISSRGVQDYLVVPAWTPELLDRIIRYTLTRKHSTDQIFHLMHFDKLTGLANRLLCNDRISQAIIRAERSGQHVAILFVDLDNFHGINETLGYDIGDMLLKEAAKRLTSSVRRQDTVARFGGDEFVVVLEGLSDPQHATVIAKQILQNFSEPVFIKEQPIFLSTSIGISVSEKDLMDGQALLKQSDIARYRAKEAGSGGGNFQYFVPALNEVAQQRLNLERELNYALTRIFRKQKLP